MAGKRALQAATANGIVAAIGIGHHAIPHLHMADAVSRRDHRAGKLMAQGKGTGGARYAAELDVAEIRAADTAVGDLYQHIVCTRSRALHCVHGDAIRGVNTYLGHGVHGCLSCVGCYRFMA